jgi:hypothetical protein
MKPILIKISKLMSNFKQGLEEAGAAAGAAMRN